MHQPTVFARERAGHVALDKSRALNTLTPVMNHFGQIQRRGYHAHLCSHEQQGGVWVRVDGWLLQPLAASLPRSIETRAVPKPSALEDQN